MTRNRTQYDVSLVGGRASGRMSAKGLTDGFGGNRPLTSDDITPYDNRLDQLVGICVRQFSPGS